MNVFDSTLSYRVALTLVHFVWQGAAVGVAAACVHLAARRWRSSSRYFVNLAALGLMAACVPVTFALVETPRGAEFATAEYAGPGGAHRRAEIGVARREPGPGRDGIADAGASRDRTAPAEGTAIAAVDAGESAGGNSLRSRRMRWALAAVAPWLTAAYFLGVGLMIARLVLAHRRLARLRAAATPVTDEGLLAAVGRLARHIGLAAMPADACCEKVAMPIVAGAVRPVILFPVWLVSGLTPDQVEAVLAHELAHLRRLDPWTNALQRVIESVLFFHPAVWYVSRRVSVEREYCCDDLVLAAGWRRVAYADALVRAAELCASRAARFGNPEFALAASGESPSQFKQRILRILGAAEVPTFTATCGAPLAVLLVLLVACSLLIGPIVAAGEAPRGAQPEPSAGSTPSTVAAAAPRVVSRPAPEEGLAARDARDAASEAVARGAGFIEGLQHEDGSWRWVGNDRMTDGLSALCTLALVRAGRGADSGGVRRSLDRLQSIEPSLTYTVALQTVLWCAADPMKYRLDVRRNVQWLVETQAAEGAARGGWSYGRGLGSADGSNTRFAVWALDAARRGGQEIPASTWRSAADYWRRSQRADGSWGYHFATPGSENMTLAGIACLAAAHRALGGDDEPLEREIDAAIERAWKWHDGRMNAAEAAPRWPFYGFHAFSAAARQTDRRLIGGEAWHKAAAERLLATQADDGAWRSAEPEQPLVATSFAILFLVEAGPPPPPEEAAGDAKTPPGAPPASAGESPSAADQDQGLEPRRAALQEMQWQFDKVLALERQAGRKVGAERTALLRRAAEGYEKLFNTYRSQAAGVHARRRQAECLRLLGDEERARQIEAELTLPLNVGS